MLVRIAKWLMNELIEEYELTIRENERFLHKAEMEERIARREADRLRVSRDTWKKFAILVVGELEPEIFQPGGPSLSLGGYNFEIEWNGTPELRSVADGQEVEAEGEVERAGDGEVLGDEETSL